LMVLFSDRVWGISPLTYAKFIIMLNKEKNPVIIK
jgi:hypothetical protein